MRTLVRLALSVSLTAACGGSPPPASTTPPPPSTSPPGVAWSFSIPVVSGWDSPDATAQDGDAWVLAYGRVRVRVSGGQTSVARDAPATDILGIVHVGERWLFVTRGGEVLAASEPLGTLSVLGAMDGQRLGSVVGWSGRLAVLDARGALYLATDDALVRVPTEGPVVDAAFTDADRGVRIDASGRVMQTSDAGAHWTEVALPLDAGFPATVFPDESERVVSTDLARDFVLAADGTLRELSEAEIDARFGHDSDEEPSDEVLAQARAHARIGGALRTGVSRGGRVLVADGSHHGHVVPDGPSLELPESYTPISWWGERLVYASDGVWYESDGTSAFAPMRWQSPADAIVDPSGRRWVMRGRCPSAPYAAPASSSSTTNDGEDEEDDEDEEESSPSEERDYDAERAMICIVEGDVSRSLAVDSLWSVVGISGDTLYVDTDSQDGMHLVAIDLATGAATVLSDAPLFGGGVTEDGVLFGNAGSDESPWRVGPPGAMVELSLPGPTEQTTRDDRYQVAAIDRDHVVAALGHDVWISSDGGHTFTDPPAPAARGARELSPERCGARACDLGDVIWALGDLAVLPRVSVVHAPGAPMLDRFEDGARAFPSVSVACDVPQPWSGHPFVPMLPSRHGRRSLFAGGALEITGSPSTSWAEGDLAGRLSGHDGAGAFDVPIRRGRVAPVHAIEDVASSHVSVSLLAATREVAVLFRAREGGDHQQSDLVAVGPALAPTVVGPLGELALTFTYAPEPRGALTLPDGSIVVWVGVDDVSWDTQGYRADVIVHVAPDGTSSIHRFESGTVRTRRVLARDAGGHPGLLVMRDTRSDFLGLDGSVRSPLPSVPTTLDAVCGPPAPGDVDFVVEGGSEHGRVYLQAQTDAPFGAATLVATLRADGSACVREGWMRVARGVVGPVNEEELDFVRGPIGFAAEGGQLVGHELAADGTPSPPFACVLAEEREERYGDERLQIAPLVDGDLALALERDDELLLGRLHGTDWDVSSVAVERDLEGSAMPWSLVRGASEPTVVRASARVTRDGVVPDEGLLGLAGDARFVTAAATATGEEGEREHALTALRADGTRAAPLEIGARIPLGVVATPLGADTFAGLLFTAEMVLDVDYFTLGHAQVQRIGLGPGGLSIGAAIPGAYGDSVLASGDRVAWLREIHDRDADGESLPVTLELLALDGARPARLGPVIGGSERFVEPAALAAFVDARTTRVAYLDGTTMHAPTHVRIVELRRGAWWDVAPPLRIEGAVAAWLDATSAIVVSSEGSAARLVDGAWTPIPLSLPPRAPPSEEP